jgi:hypothetical protein
MLIAGIFPLASRSFAQGTAFTYQGQLNAAGGPASGVFDFVFSLYQTNLLGSPVVGPVTNFAVPVSNGYFLTTIDFGNVFTATNYWLDIAVRTNGATTFTELAPRQSLTPTPLALYAATADNVNGAVMVDSNGIVTSPADFFTANSNAITTVIDAATNALQKANNLSDVTSATAAAHNLGLGAADSPTFLNLNVNLETTGGVLLSSNSTVSQPIQIYTNAASANGNGYNMIQMGVASDPGIFSMWLNPMHGGTPASFSHSELDWSLSRWAIINNENGNGGVIQVNGQGLLGLWALCFQDQGSGTSGKPAALSGGLIAFRHGSWNGAAAVRGAMDITISAVNTNGDNGTLTLFNSYSFPNDANDSPIVYGVPHTVDWISGLGSKVYGTRLIDQAAVSSTPDGGTFNINLGMAWQDATPLGDLTIGITNLNLITNTALANGTTTAVTTEVFLYPGGTDHNVTWLIPASVNMILENVTALPPMLTNNRITHLSLKYAVVSGVTNCFASFAFPPYVPVSEPSEISDELISDVNDGNHLTESTDLTGGLVTETSDYNIKAKDSIVLLNGNALTATLPTAASAKGRHYTIKLIASATATIATSDNQTVDGASTYSLAGQYKYVTVQSDGMQWWVIANN